MKVVIGDPEGSGVRLEETDDLRRLSVSTELPSAEIQAAMDLCGAGAYAGDHCWLTIAILRERGPGDEQWRREFDEMISYAAAHGWVADGWVRAHFET